MTRGDGRRTIMPMPLDKANHEFRRRLSAPKLTVTYTLHARFRLNERGITVSDLVAMLKSSKVSKVIRSEEHEDRTTFVIETRSTSQEPLFFVVELVDADELRILSVFVGEPEF